MAAPAPAAASSAASSAGHIGPGSHAQLTPEQRAQRHVLPIEGCPSLAQFQQLIALQSHSAEAAAAAGTHSAGAGTGGGSGTSEDAALLDSMLSWCSALFLRHDRALASSNLFTDIHAALCALRPHARRASISHSAKRSSAKSRRRSHSRSRSRSHSGSNNNAEAEGHGAGAGAGAASTEAASSAASAASTEASLTASTAGADAPDPLVGVISRMSSYPFSGYISRISTELMDLVTSCGGAEVDESWSLLNGESGGGKGDPEKISVFYRKLAGSGTHSFLVSGIVHAPLLNLLAMIKEVDLMPQWLGAVQSAEVLSELDGSRYRMLLRVIVKALWPVSDREAMCYGYGDVVGDSVGIYFRSVDDQGKGEIIPGAGVGGSDVQVPPVTEGCVRASVSMGGFYITPRSLATEDAPQAASCMVRGVFNVDPHLPIIPFWFLNVMSEKFCSVILQMMRAKAPRIFGAHIRGDETVPLQAEWIMASPANAETEYAKRLITQARVYEEIRRRIAEMHQNAGAAGKS